MINEIQNAKIGNSQLETLYKTTATGAIQTWRVDVESDSYTVTHGQQGGKPYCPVGITIRHDLEGK